MTPSNKSEYGHLAGRGMVTVSFMTFFQIDVYEK